MIEGGDVSFVDRLIQAAVGSSGGFGAMPLKRMGCAAKATSSAPGSLRAHRLSGAVVHGGRGHQADAAVGMFVVVPAEELLAVRAGVLDRTEPFREVGTVFQGLELRLGVRIVI